MNGVKIASREIEIRYSHSSENLMILTYDSLIHNAQQNSSNQDRYIILSLRDGDKYKTKHVPDVVDTSIFAYLNPEELELNDAHLQTLINCGYNIPEWEKGNLLVLNDKQPMHEFQNLLNSVLRASQDSHDKK